MESSFHPLLLSSLSLMLRWSLPLPPPLTAHCRWACLCVDVFERADQYMMCKQKPKKNKKTPLNVYGFRWSAPWEWSSNLRSYGLLISLYRRWCWCVLWGDRAPLILRTLHIQVIRSKQGSPPQLWERIMLIPRENFNPKGAVFCQSCNANDQGMSVHRNEGCAKMHSMWWLLWCCNNVICNV